MDGKDFWRVVGVPVLFRALESISFGVVVVACATGVKVTERQEEESLMLRHRTVCRRC